MLKECPPPLPADSEAVRESGHGIKEYAIYYEMIRYLLAEAWSRLDGCQQFTHTQATLVDTLRACAMNGSIGPATTASAVALRVG